MPLDEETIAQQLALLAAHRRALAFELRREAESGALAPPGVEARANIARVKAYLRENGVPVQDEPNDEGLDTTPSPPSGTKTVYVEGAVKVGTMASDSAATGVTIGQLTGTTIHIHGADTAALSVPPALHQLRPPVGDFVGREREIDQLVRALGGASGDGAAAGISGVRGMGGIGKTELAYAVAQQLKDAFPDAQLLVELRGASDSPLAPEQALQNVIRAFEREAKLPDDLGQLQAIYRDRLNGRRVLVLADDARDAAQVRPLLPPAGCALLVTSRNHFELPGMETFDLRTLPKDEAEKLLLDICPRIGAAAPELARLCGYLPLALRVSASLLAARPSRRVEASLAQLRDERTRLEHLRDPRDPELDVAASLRLSYDSLAPAGQATLCQLSVFPASFDGEAARNVVVPPPGDAIDGLLEDLCLLSLLEWDAALERYSLHDLVRAFAAARLEDADAVRLRHARHYARVAWYAEDRLYLTGKVLAGLTLFDQERVHIDMGWAWAQERAGNPVTDVLLLFYVNATAYIGDLRFDKRRERIPQLEIALTTARRLGHKDAEGSAIGTLGLTYAALGELRRAIECHEQHLAIATKTSNRRMESKALGNLGIAYNAVGDTWKAIECYDQALAIDREIGDRRGEANSLGNLGIAYKNLGDVQKAIEYHDQALAIDREISDRRGEGADLGNLGIAYAILGDVRRAIECQEQSLAIAREIGDRYGEGESLNSLGLCYVALGDVQQAIEFYEQRLSIAREIGDRPGEALTSWNLGLRLNEQGDLARAVELMQVYVDYLRAIGHPETDQRAAQVEQVRQRQGRTGPTRGWRGWWRRLVGRSRRVI